jgi:hypothetical protein
MQAYKLVAWGGTVHLFDFEAGDAASKSKMVNRPPVRF